MKRWKVAVELLGGIVMVGIGGFMMAEAGDVVPFTVHEPVSLLLGVVVAVYGWTVVGRAWKVL